MQQPDRQPTQKDEATSPGEGGCGIEPDNAPEPARTMLMIAQRHLAMVTEATLSNDKATAEEAAIVTSVFSAAAIDAAVTLYCRVRLLFVPVDARTFVNNIMEDYERFSSVRRRLALIKDHMPPEDVSGYKALVSAVEELSQYRNRLVHGTVKYLGNAEAVAVAVAPKESKGNRGTVLTGPAMTHAEFAAALNGMPCGYVPDVGLESSIPSQSAIVRATGDYETACRFIKTLDLSMHPFPK